MQIAAIIPAYNEAETIGEVIKVVRQVPDITEIIVVDDGSRDNTALAASEAGAKVISLPQNVGKGGAMTVGVQSTRADILLFMDADLIGLCTQHVQEMLDPVVTGVVDMSIGVFGHGRFATDLAQYITPYLSGQRALRREIFEKISGLDVTRFGVEVALTRYTKSAGISCKEVELKQLSHLMKEEKLGLVKGFVARMKMYWEIAKCVGKS